MVGLALLCVFGTALYSRGGPEKEPEEARRSLRQEGFKTDLSDFNFLTDTATAARAAALTNVVRTRPPVLLQPCGTECAIIAWKGANFQDEEEGYQSLPPIEQELAKKQANLDAACAAALASPIRFPLNAQHGSAMLLVHLAPLKNLSQTLAARMIVELRDKHYSAAWTNLLALTRLATAWEPEPSDISHVVRFNLARNAWKAAWQALQSHNWTEEQLLALQHEWEAPDFFKGLPETVAFTRACMVDTCIRERTNSSPGIPLKDTVRNAVESPSSIVSDAKYRLGRMQYRNSGTYEDEHDLLIFFGDRERELRKAIRSSTWLEMRGLPGVTNQIPFRSKYTSRMQLQANLRQMARSMQSEGKTLVALAAEAETRRRLVIAAIGLERYHIAHGSYPKDLQSLAPDILKSLPVDFMDGKPLRYRLAEPASFVLYSIGLDCVDDGGKLSVANTPAPEYPKLDPFDARDMVWPKAASDAETEAFHLGQVRAKEDQKREWEREAEEQEKEQEDRRQGIIERLAKMYANGGSPKTADPKVEGGFLSEVLRNKAVPGPPLTIEQMLTLHQIITGKEPDMATFEVPVSYDALTNLGGLKLLCDANPREDYSSEPEAQDCERATNGNCRLVWNTTYDPPGKHFLQARLWIENWRGRSRRRNYDAGEISLKGPLFAFVSTNVIQFLPLGNVLTEKGAFFQVKLAQPVGSYSLKLTTPTGEHIRTITGSTSNGIVEVQWDLIDDNGKRYTNDSLNSTWTVTFPDAPKGASTNSP